MQFLIDISKSIKLKNYFEQICIQNNFSSLSEAVYAWHLSHPVNIIPIIGTGNIPRITEAANSINKRITREQWFNILEISTGKKVD